MSSLINKKNFFILSFYFKKIIKSKTTNKMYKMFQSSVTYFHFILNSTYKDLISQKPLQYSDYLISTALNDIISQKYITPSIWTRNDNVPKELNIICPVIQNYLLSKK